MADDLALGMPHDEAGARQWRLNNKKPRPGTQTNEPSATSRSHWESKRAQVGYMRELLELQEQQGKLVDAGDVARLWQRQIHEAKSQLNQLPGRIAQKLPAGLSADDRKKVRLVVQDQLDRAYAALARLTLDYLQGQDAEEEDEE